jgi:AAA+ superfamily predicted ATPase
MRSKTELAVDAKAADGGLEDARRAVENSGIPALLAAADSGGFGTTPLNLRMLDALAAALAVVRAARRASPEALPAPYLAFLLAEEAAHSFAALGPVEAPGPAGALPVGEYRELASSPEDGAADFALKDCAAFLKFYLNHPKAALRLSKDADSLRCLHSYFRMLSKAAAALVSAEPAVTLTTPSMKFDGLRASSTGQEPSELLPISFDDLVGNEDFIKAGRRLAGDVAGFDLKSGVNPKSVRNQILFVLGAPGCGKTATAHAIGRHFLDLCAKGGLPARMRVIRRTDWASAYQNQSAKALLDIFQNEVFNAPGVCGVYWPDIDTAFAARGDSDLRQEEKAILATLFGILDGTVGPKNGRWFMICDANTVNMDEAALSRISQNPIRAYGPRTAEDFTRLLRGIKLRQKTAFLPLTDAEWAVVGKRCADEGLSGRAVDAVAGRVLTEIEDFEEPPEYYALGFEEKKKLIEKLSRPVPAARLLQMIDDFCRFERDSQQKAEKERFLSRVKEIRLALSAQQAAIGLGETHAPAPEARQ